MNSTPRILFAASSSGTGKTTVTCGVLEALKNRGLSLCSFKCGPDFVDPLFHRSILGIPSTNLDLFFTTPQQVRGQVNFYSKGKDLAVIEGVMGLYDGVGATSEASSWQISVETKTPIILVVNTKGMAMSLAALIKGFADFKGDKAIQGIILNRCSHHIAEFLTDIVKKETGIPVVGYLPEDREIAIESQRLGLKPEEEKNFEHRFAKLAKQVEISIDLDKILAIAKTRGELEESWTPPENTRENIRIGVAKDSAFCFMYRENMDILEGLGGELVYFSPIHDSLPENLSGLYLGGGYLDRYVKELSENTGLLKDIGNAYKNGMPIYAEGGGFMYLHKEYTKDTQSFPLVGAIKESGQPSNRLGNFGYFYGDLSGQLYGESAINPLKGHEFHYFQSSNGGSGMTARKPTSSKEWETNYITGQIFAGFPYFYFPGNLSIPQGFIKTCKEYREKWGHYGG